jgi:hypothetical protein
MLSSDYPGFFAVGDTPGLRRLLLRAEQDQAFYASLVEGVRAKASIADPHREVAAWGELLNEVT